MTASRGATESYWVASTADVELPRLEDDLEVDVAVLGAGITGITAARRLKLEGKTVALVEARRVVRGATGFTTAKLTAGHGLVYSRLERSFGAEAARLYAEANSAAVDEIRRTAAAEGIDCDLEETRNLVYSESREDVDALNEEAQAARRAGLEAAFSRQTELPFDVAGAVVLEGQAQFHPRRYLLPLVAALPGEGSHVFVETRAIGVDGDGPMVVRTDRGSVRARDVVVATHLPFLDRGLFFARAHPYRSYVVAAEIDPESAPRDMHVTSGRPTRSIRSTPREAGRLLIVGGEGHKPGDEERTEERYVRLAEWAGERFGVERFTHRWSTQDLFSVDHVPFAGVVRRGSDHVYVATGYGGWGLTNGTAAGLLVADLILGRSSRFARLYDPNRVKVFAGGVDFARENAQVGFRFFADRAAAWRRRQVWDLTPGEGRVVRLGGDLLAVHRRDDGGLQAVSAVCTHLGCVVGWNAAERSWDCPCHGSRFAADGTVLEGPAVRDLDRRDETLR